MIIKKTGKEKEDYASFYYTLLRKSLISDLLVRLPTYISYVHKNYDKSLNCKNL